LEARCHSTEWPLRAHAGRWPFGALRILENQLLPM
jgi:hypothetical protein